MMKKAITHVVSSPPSKDKCKVVSYKPSTSTSTLHQQTGLNRNVIDKYYTKPDMVDVCMNLFKHHVSYSSDNDVCIEPSAGNGAFMAGIKKIFNHTLFFDLIPEHPHIIQQDFLTFNFDTLSGQYDKIHVIGNPPFGRQSSLAVKFIKKCQMYCDTISFILPKSFKKDSMKNVFSLNFHLIHEWDLPDDSFNINNESIHVPCVFQIWIKQTEVRPKAEKLTPINYTFVKKEEHHDMSFRRVGVYAGGISRHTIDKSPQSHYFIKFHIPLTEELYASLSTLIYHESGNTVGPKSISKQELIKQFNTIMINQNNPL